MERAALKILFLLLSVTNAVQAKRSFDARFTRISCDANKDVANFSCQLDFSNKARPALDIYSKFLQQVDEMFIDLFLSVIRSKDNIVLLNLTSMDACSMFKMTARINFVGIFMKVIRKYSKYVTECPMAPNSISHISKMTCDAEWFPPYTPEGEYEVGIRLHNPSLGLMITSETYIQVTQLVRKRFKHKKAK